MQIKKENICHFFVNYWQLIILVIIGIFYIGNTYSPSSYAYPLHLLGIDTPVTLGEARAIRSDEWSVQTPLTQAVVHNGFERYNVSSLFQEDLRINYGLPIFDWGLIFKPAQWGYLVFQPAYAFSFYYYFLFCAFVVGFSLFFRKLGLSHNQSFLLAIALYFSGGIQFWWTVNAPTFAFFPWAVLSVAYDRFKWWNVLLSIWIICSWQISNLYPAFTLALAIVGFVWLYIVKGNMLFRLKYVAIVLLISICSLLIVATYFYDYLLLMTQTIYPGSRSVSGGDPMARLMLLAVFIPNIFYDSQFSLVGLGEHFSNICESGVVSSLFPLLFLSFVVIQKRDNQFFYLPRKMILPVSLLVLMLLWIVVPIPNTIGKYILFDKIQPVRMAVVFPLLLTIIFVKLMSQHKSSMTIYRVIIFVFILLFTEYLFKGFLDIRDFIPYVCLFLVGIFFAVKKYSGHMFICIAACLFAVMTTFLFNPVYKAKYIFMSQNSILLNEIASEVKQKGFTTKSMLGAVLNGLGYRAITQVNTTPQLSFWQHKFPYLSQSQLNRYFNRYMHISLSTRPEIKVITADHVSVPIDCFKKDHLFGSCSLDEIKVNYKNNITPIEILDKELEQSQLTDYCAVDSIDDNFIDNHVTLVRSQSIHSISGWFSASNHFEDDERVFVLLKQRDHIYYKVAITLDINRPDVVAAIPSIHNGVVGYHSDFLVNNLKLGEYQIYLYAQSGDKKMLCNSNKKIKII